MALPTGTKLGPYEVVAPLGSGGMGEVYRARDSRLGREVAIKVLPADRLADPRRRARFVHEARAASALNHPHIVTIYEIEQAEGIDFIVMELVPGETLARALRHGPLPTDEALRIAIPLADALAAAHAAGIVHRDLKPGNVMVTPDGVVKVLDFGLAKLVRGDTADSEEATATAPPEAAPLSRPGAVTGTSGYMSPEQASGGSVDARSDVFSFGVLLYEMVTGRRAFAGGSSAEALAAVLKEQPKPPSELVPGVPKELERVIARCLRKEPGRRFQNMADVKIELLEIKEESDSQATASAGARTLGSRRRRLAWVVAGVVLLALAAAGTLWRLRPGELPPPRLVQLGWTGREGYGSFSPDGTQIVFTSREEKGDEWHVWLKFIGETEARRLTSNPVDLMVSVPAWSPDGKQIAFARSASPAAAGGICLVSPVGGAERRLLDFPTSPFGQLSWSLDGSWLAAGRSRARGETTPESGGIHLVPVGGGDPRAVTFPKPPTFDRDPAFSPDGRALAYASCGGLEAMPACDVYVVPLDSDLRPRGQAQRLSRQGLWIMGLAWMRDGSSIVWGGGANSQLWRVRADGSTPPQPVELAGTGARAPSSARGQDRLVFTRYRWAPAIYRIPLGGAPTLLTESTAADMWPQYSPDGRRIAFESGRTGTDEIWLAEASGANPTRLTRGPGRQHGSPRWSPDGRSVAFDSQGEDGHWDIWTIGVDGSRLRQVTRDPADENMPSFSRDGRFIYFSSNRTGRDEVWRIPAAGGAEEQVTRSGGAVPFESLDGRTLYYLRSGQNDALLARPTAGGTERVIFPCVDIRSYAVAPQGLFHVDCHPPESRNARQHVLCYWDAVTGQDRPVTTFDADWTAGLSASPDGRSVIYGRSIFGWDLVMIENFR